MTRNHAHRHAGLHALFVAVTLALCFTSVDVAQAAKAPKGFFGVAVPHLRDASYNNRINSLTALVGSGVDVVPHVFDWAALEPTAGEFHFEYADQAVLASTDAGLALTASIFNAPDWATSRPGSGAKPGYYPPKDAKQFARFAARLAERYGPNGRLWKEHGIAEKPIRVWRIWNEPNLPVYWASGPNAREYLALLRAARQGIRAVDRGAAVATAGIPDSRLGISMHNFIKGMYKAGGRKVIDGISLNPYAVDQRGVMSAIKRTRSTLKKYRDTSTKFWITEIGWSDAGPPSPFFAGTAGQARRIKRTIDGVLKVRRSARIAGFTYFALRDQLVAKSNDFWGNHTGLFTSDGAAKPAWKAFYSRTRKARGVVGPLPSSTIAAIPGDPGYHLAGSRH